MTISRRQMLCRSAGLTFGWGGMRMAAGQSATRGKADLTSEFIYGTAFYRPPNPPRAQRRGMLKSIREDYGFNIIRIYPGWDYYNPGPDKFVFDDLDEVMGFCDEFGIRVLLGLVLETAPWWLEQAHPETRYINALGAPRKMQGSGNNMTGGWPGLCLDWQPVRAAAERYIHALAAFARKHQSMYAYDCWNEPHIEPAWERSLWATPPEMLYCYCPATVQSFHDWLRKRYGDLDRLNEAWTRRYPNFEAIDPPRAMGTYADWVDWRRYIIERSTAELAWRVRTLRAADTSSVMEDHAAHHPPFDGIAVGGVNLWRLAEEVELWGLSLFPRWFSFAVYEGAAKIEITRAAANGKPFWMTELQGGHGNKGLWRSHKMRPQDIRLWNWLAVAAGAKGIVYWTYHTEGTGSEATGFGLVERSGAPSERVREAARNRVLIQQVYADILKNYRPRTNVALLHDQDNALLTYAMSGDESPSTLSFRGYYKAIWALDHWAHFLEPAGLASDEHSVLIVPWHLVGKKETCEHVLRRARAGATVILETSFGLYDERFFHNPVVPPHGLAETLGYQEGESLYVIPPQASGEVQASSAFTSHMRPAQIAPNDRIYYEPWMEFTEPAAVRIRAHTYLTPIEVKTAKVIARCEGMPVAAVAEVGRGRVYYIGTNLGAAIAAGDAGAFALAQTIIRRAAPPAVSGTNLRPRLIEGERGALLLAFNDTVQNHQETLKIPGRYRHARDLHSEAEIPVRNGSIEVAVPYESVTVLRLS